MSIFVNVKDFRYQLARRRKIRSHAIQVGDIGLHILESIGTALDCISTSAYNVLHDLKILGRFISRLASLRNSDKLKSNTDHNTDCRSDSRTSGATNHKTDSSPGKSASEDCHKRTSNINATLNLMNQSSNHQRYANAYNRSCDTTDHAANLETNSCTSQRPSNGG